MVLSLVLLHPARKGEREREKEGREGCLRMVRGKLQLKPIGRKNGCSLVWRMQSRGNAEEGSFSLVFNVLLGLSWIAAVLCNFAHIVFFGSLRCEAKRHSCSPLHA